MLTLETPTRLRITEVPKPEVLRQQLTYVDKRVRYELNRIRNSPWMIKKLGPEAHAARVQELKAQEKQCLLLEDGQGLYTHSGLHSLLSRNLQTQVVNRISYPEPEGLAWNQVPFKLHPYQAEALEKLIAARHGAVEMGTGLGKSLIIQYLCRHYGLQTLVMAPSVSIAGQLHRGLQESLGRARVGQFFDGKKQVDKLVTVATPQSLLRLEPGDPVWTHLATTQVFIADESHQCPADTLARVCLGLCAAAPYRFFFSATQLRGDGLDLLLAAITGPIVYEMTVHQGVDAGYLARPEFRVVHVESQNRYEGKDAMRMQRLHLLRNPVVNRVAADIVNQSVAEYGHQVLILIDEMDQFGLLYPLLRYRAGFAHGPLNEDNRDSVPEAFRASDPTALVEEFNAGRLPVLVGTSCISMGTDVKACKTLIYLQGGCSEVQVRQAIGRSTRLAEGKTACTIVDFCVDNVAMLKRHAEQRMRYYRETYPSLQEVHL